MIFGWNPPIFEQTNALMKLNIERSKKKTAHMLLFYSLKRPHTFKYIKKIRPNSTLEKLRKKEINTKALATKKQMVSQRKKAQLIPITAQTKNN